MDPEQPDGMQLAVVHGNPMEGPSAFFLKIPAGANAGTHSHTTGYHAVVVSGPVTHWLPGDKDKSKLEPGSYWYQPGGQPHGDKCDGDAECVVFLVTEGKLDFTPNPDVKETKDRGSYKMVKVADAKYEVMQEGGPKISMLWGDPQAGPVAFGIEFAPGAEAGMHKHSSDYHALVLAGTHAHWRDGEEAPEKGLVPGSYFFQPSEKFHNDACRGDATCRTFVYMPGKMDMTPKEGGDEGDDGE
jgi:quercetin dioxygenase-like cupin family protein